MLCDVTTLILNLYNIYIQLLTAVHTCQRIFPRGELSYLAPLGSENISAPYFKQCFFRGGGYYPPDGAKHHASQSQDKFTHLFINERKRNANTYLISNFDSLEAALSNLPP